MGFDDETIQFADHERGLHVFRCVYADFFADVPAFGAEMRRQLSKSLMFVPYVSRIKKQLSCFYICVVYRVDPVIVVRGCNDILNAHFTAADALDFGAKVCPFCGGWRCWVIWISNKFQAFFGIVFCLSEFDGAAHIFGKCSKMVTS